MSINAQSVAAALTKINQGVPLIDATRGLNYEELLDLAERAKFGHEQQDKREILRHLIRAAQPA